MVYDQILMGTGPRDWSAGSYLKFKADLAQFVEFQRSEYEYNISIISGGAQGFDIALAKAASELSVPYAFLLPNPTYVDYYYAGKGHRANCLGRLDTMRELMLGATSVEYASQTLYVEVNKRSVHSNFVRNDLMVAKSDLLVAGYDSTGTVPMAGGTGHAVRAALAAGLDCYDQVFQLAERPRPQNSDLSGVNF